MSDVANDSEPQPSDDQSSSEGTEPSAAPDSALPQEEDDGTPEEVEYEGATYSLPRKLKNALLRHADYTRKTQALANERRTYEARVKHDADVAQFRESFRKESGALDTINRQLERYRGVDWNKWGQGDPAAAKQHSAVFNNLLQHRDRILAHARTRIESLQQSHRVQQQRRADAAHAELRARIPDWSSAKQETLYRFAADSFGFRGDELRGVDDPRVIQVLHDAYLYRQGMKGARVQPEERRVQPVARVQTLGRVSGEPSDSDDARTWLKKRYAQLERRR